MGRFHYLCLLLVASSEAARVLQHNSADLNYSKSLTCEDLANNSTYDLSFEGSWSYLRLDPLSSPFSMGSLAYMTFSDTHHTDNSTANPMLFPLPITLKVGNNGERESSSCRADSYTWRPDFTTTIGSCSTFHDTINVSMKVAYQSNSTICASYRLRSEHPRNISFEGVVPEDAPNRRASMRLLPERAGAGNAVLVEIHATKQYEGNFAIDRYFLLQTSSANSFLEHNEAADDDSVLSSPHPSSDDPTGYTLPRLLLPGGGEKDVEVEFCLTELEQPPEPPVGPSPQFNVSACTESVNNWLSEARPPPGISGDLSALRRYYSSWFQFWYNTEHDAGNWIYPAITPSMSRYGRGVWLWDTAFHIFALLSGGTGPRTVRKAREQLEILLGVARDVGHIPRVVGPEAVEETTQPPGILTWAALAVYNVTGDLDFLRDAYEVLATNNEWFYANRSTRSGLCEWEGQDSGWDTSPRWDGGSVEAIDLNSWLHLDQLFLAAMAEAIGLPPTEITKWKLAASRSREAIQARLWDDDAGVFWDRRPSPDNRFVSVVTPATFWPMLAGIANATQSHRIAERVLTKTALLTPHPLSSVGRSEPAFDPEDYWRGPVWINVNWLASLGLHCSGLHSDAELLLDAAVELVAKWPYPWEYYDPMTGAGLGAQNFMWTGAVNIIMLSDNPLVQSLLYRHMECDTMHSKSSH